MFEDLFVAAAVIAIAFLMYKWFELIVLKKERLMIVERLENGSLLEYVKRLPIGIKSGGVSQETKNSRMVHPVGKVLRWGLLLISVGLGFIIAIYNIGVEEYSSYSEVQHIVMLSCVMLCGGLGLVISFVIEYFLCKKNE